MSADQAGQRRAPVPVKEERDGTQRSDAELIQACLEGDGEAWEFLVNGYRRLIYSIPFKWGCGGLDRVDLCFRRWPSYEVLAASTQSSAQRCCPGFGHDGRRRRLPVANGTLPGLRLWAQSG